MLNIKVCVFNKLLVSGESSFSAHDARHVVAFLTARNAVMYVNNQAVVISWCFLGCSHCHQKYTLILSRLSGAHELIDGSST